ncbi:MAG: DNA polymerase III subunit delta [Firmicutes bacterium]|nr:DNA polymerase III subunit delta [Bacillota bacterium]
MPALPATEFLQRLVRGRPMPHLLLLGRDAYLRELCRARLIETCLPEAARPWAVHRFSLHETDVAPVLQQARSLPMLAERQVIFLSDLQRAETWSEETREALRRHLEAYFRDPAPFTVLVLEAETLDQRTRLAKFLTGATLVVEVELPGEARREGDPQRREAAVTLTREIARERGVTIDPSAAARLADLLDSNLARIRTEIEKLACFVGERKAITGADVDALVVGAKTYAVWTLADLLAQGRRREALVLVNRLLEQGETGPGLVGALAWMYRKLLEAQQLPPGLNRWQLAAKLRMSAEAAELARQSARRIPRRQLLEGLRVLYEADNRLKSGVRDTRAVLEFLLVELLPKNVAPARPMR